MKKRSVFLLTTLFLGVFVFSTGMATASTLLFDRGLPTDNFNWAAGSNRSNVAWADLDYFVGDDFSNNTSYDWSVDEITAWVVGDSNVTDWELWLGSGDTSDLAEVTTISSQVNQSIVYYNDDGSTNYETSTQGTYLDITEITFSGLDLYVNAGDTYNFSVRSDTVRANTVSNSWVDGRSPFLHASNAALSVSTQEGADDLYKLFNPSNGAFVQTEDSNQQGIWDKSSDINIQITGNAVPEPATMLLFGVGLLGIAGVSRRKRA